MWVPDSGLVVVNYYYYYYFYLKLAHHMRLRHNELDISLASCYYNLVYIFPSLFLLKSKPSLCPILIERTSIEPEFQQPTQCSSEEEAELVRSVKKFKDYTREKPFVPFRK